MPEWKYLYSDVFKIRYVIAAQYLRGCPAVVEIGGYKTPIDGFLTHDFSSVVVIDPLIEPTETPRVRHLACDYRDVDYSFLAGQSYGLAMLGFDLSVSDKLVNLACGAAVVVVEFSEAPDWSYSREAVDALIVRAGLTTTARIHLDLSGNDYGDLTDSWPPRTNRFLYVLRQRSGSNHQP